MKIEVKVTCDECGGDLEAETTRLISGLDVEALVKPCYNCVESRESMQEEIHNLKRNLEKALGNARKKPSLTGFRR